MKWINIDLSFKLSVTYGDNVNYYKSVHHPIPILPVGTGNTLAIFKTNQYWVNSSPFNWVSRYSLLAQTKRKKKDRFWKGARSGTTLWDYPQEHLVVIKYEKVSPFVEFEIILPILSFLLDLATNKHRRTWSSMTNL